MSVIVFIITWLATLHTLVFYDIYNNTCQVPSGNNYTIFFAVFLVVIMTLLPHTLMLIFSLITFSNLKKNKAKDSTKN